MDMPQYSRQANINNYYKNMQNLHTLSFKTSSQEYLMML